ncbi:MAG: hypothetical protein K0S47_1868 [Herbinix sp.]|jgi:hypothetical protein|nr:hypothetical protein [Herbinix sp.]
MSQKPEEVIFTTAEGEEVTFRVLEQTKLSGFSYLLVTDDSDDEDEAEALILKDVSLETDEEAIYDIVEDEQELEVLAGIFRELVEDIDLY